MKHSFVNKPERPWPNPYLEVAAIVGHTTPHSSRLWFRTHTPGHFVVLVFALSEIPSGAIDSVLAEPHPTLAQLDELRARSADHYALQVYSFESSPETDTTAVIDIENLKADSHYRYLLWNEDTDQPVLGHQRPLTLKTFAEVAGPISFGFFSCHMPYKKTLFGRTQVVNEQMWDYFHEMLSRHNEKDLRFVLAGGDQVYSDGVETLSIWNFLKKVMRREGDQLLPDIDEMITWYRDIYRGYWGFPALREVFSSFPTYMIWDDHEIADGWGSFRFAEGMPRDEIDEILPDQNDSNLSYQDRFELIQRMVQAAKHVYWEYQHSHNPNMQQASPAFPADAYDYHIEFPKGALYVLDGRGQRDFDRSTLKILGKDQLERFKNWIEGLNVETTPFIFVASAVPMVHLSHVLVDQGEGILADIANVTDDLRDGWEHKAHQVENRTLLKYLFKAAKKGHRVCILSGDVHVAAAFRLTDPDSGKVIYQLTSSAITYNQSRALGWALGKVVPDTGVTHDGYQFKRLARYTDSNFSLISVDPDKDMVDFQLYGEQVTHDPDNGDARQNSHSIAKIELRFTE